LLHAFAHPSIPVSVGLFLRPIAEHTLLRAATELEHERVEPCPISGSVLPLADDTHHHKCATAAGAGKGGVEQLENEPARDRARPSVAANERPAYVRRR
jgi:hypothetical protein